MHQSLKDFKECYSDFNGDSLKALASVYHPAIVFIDPVHRVEGLVALERYFADIMSNVSSCRFNFLHELVGEDSAYLQWQMVYQHPSLAGNKPISVVGVSRLVFSEGKVIEHEDYYDMGAMLYEQLPVFGRLVRWLRRRVAGK